MNREALNKRPFVVACILAFNEERTIARVVVQTKRFVDCVVVCGDGSGGLTGEVAGATCLYDQLEECCLGCFCWMGNIRVISADI